MGAKYDMVKKGKGQTERKKMQQYLPPDCNLIGVSFCEFFDVAQSDDNLLQDLAKFGYKLNMNIKLFKHPSIFLAIFEQCIKIW
jgi:hypothetical protein